MNKKLSLVTKSFLSTVLIFNAIDVFAQAGGGNNNLLIYTLIVIGAILLLGAIMQVSDNLLQIEAKKQNVSRKGIGLFPRLAHALSPSLPEHLQGEDVHDLKRGFDIKLEGQANGEFTEPGNITRYAIQPGNWRGIAPIPKMIAEQGQNLKAGQPLFYDKSNPDIKYVAPVSGEMIELNRGAKRAIAEIVILADKEIQYEQFEAPDPESATREELVAFLCETGGWTHIRQRPYDIVANTDVVPVNVFISTFDTAPLAPDLNIAVEGREAEFQKGLDVLGKLTSGSVHLGLDGRNGRMPATAFSEASGVEKHYFRGPHPCGNVGIQIHHIQPVSAGNKVWVLGVQDVITIGGLFLHGRYDASRVIAVTGAPVKSTGYVRTYVGVHLGELLANNLEAGRLRIISGDVLSGEAKGNDGYLNIYDDQVTVLAEGDHYDIFGWLMPGEPRPSASKTYITGLIPGLKYEADTNTHGERRAFVMTGQYERVLPMDIYPQHLMKAIMSRDFERMEGLGIHELTEEDIALCEFACTSKMPLQQILREGLELMREQG